MVKLRESRIYVQKQLPDYRHLHRKGCLLLQIGPHPIQQIFADPFSGLRGSDIFLLKQHVHQMLRHPIIFPGRRPGITTGLLVLPPVELSVSAKHRILLCLGKHLYIILHRKLRYRILRFLSALKLVSQIGKGDLPLQVSIGMCRDIFSDLREAVQLLAQPFSRILDSGVADFIVGEISRILIFDIDAAFLQRINVLIFDIGKASEEAVDIALVSKSMALLRRQTESIHGFLDIVHILASPAPVGAGIGKFIPALQSRSDKSLLAQYLPFLLRLVALLQKLCRIPQLLHRTASLQRSLLLQLLSMRLQTVSSLFLLFLLFAHGRSSRLRFPSLFFCLL